MGHDDILRSGKGCPVNQVSFAEAGGGDSLAGTAYQMVALRRPALTDGGMHPLEAQFLVDCANGMLGGPRPRLQPASTLAQLADGIILWCGSPSKPVFALYTLCPDTVEFGTFDFTFDFKTSTGWPGRQHQSPAKRAATTAIAPATRVYRVDVILRYALLITP